MDIHSITKAPIANSSKKTAAAGNAKKVGTRDTSIYKQLPDTPRFPNRERRKKERRHHDETILVELRNGSGRRSSDREGNSRIDINV